MSPWVWNSGSAGVLHHVIVEPGLSPPSANSFFAFARLYE